MVKFHQPENVRDEVFLKKYKAYYEVLTQSGGRLGAHPAMILEHLKKMGINPIDDGAVLAGYEQAMEVS